MRIGNGRIFGLVEIARLAKTKLTVKAILGYENPLPPDMCWVELKSAATPYIEPQGVWHFVGRSVYFLVAAGGRGELPSGF